MFKDANVGSCPLAYVYWRHYECFSVYLAFINSGVKGIFGEMFTKGTFVVKCTVAKNALSAGVPHLNASSNCVAALNLMPKRENCKVRGFDLFFPKA